MDATELKRCVDMLASRKEELSQAVGDRLHRHGLEIHEQAGLPRRSDDTDDDAAASSMRDADVVGLARAARELALIDAAYERLAAGCYGMCVDCADPIVAQRLLANPEAARCAECQQLFEHAHPESVRSPLT